MFLQVSFIKLYFHFLLLYCIGHVLGARELEGANHLWDPDLQPWERGGGWRGFRFLVLATPQFSWGEIVFLCWYICVMYTLEFCCDDAFGLLIEASAYFLGAPYMRRKAASFEESAYAQVLRLID